MNILVISNGAPGYYRFFNRLAMRLFQERNEICFAVDSNASFAENEIEKTKLPYRIFSDYFSNHVINNKILEQYGRYNLNSALLSDYERAVVYKLWGQKDDDFYEKLKSALLTFFTELITESQIDAVLYENVSNSFAHFCWFVCHEHGVKYLGLTGSRLPGRFWITSDPRGESRRVDLTLKKIESGELEVPENVIKWCREYIDRIDNIVPDYMKFNGLDNTDVIKKYLKPEKLHKIILGIKHFRDDHYHSYQRGNPLNLSWQMFLRTLKRKLRLRRVETFYSLGEEEERFLLYPLHFHPEASTSILAGTYYNELETIRNIAFNLPQGLKLYVKDHVSAFGYPELGFYRKLNALPNVRILQPYAPTKELIKKSQAVITLTSTVGYEALLLNKRVFLFGDVFYQSHKNITKIINPSELFDVLRDVSQVLDDEGCKEYNVKYVASYYMNTFPGVLTFNSGVDEAESLVDDVLPWILRCLKD